MKRVTLFITFIRVLMAFYVRSEETQADRIQNSRRKIEGRRTYARGISASTETYEIKEVAELVRDHRKGWKEAVLKECSFRKTFKMNQEISDSYCKMSPSGAMDLSDIAFRGFSFR